MAVRLVLPSPPLHPHCRCQVEPYDIATQGRDYPEALKREAKRSVVKGWSLPSESEKERLRAADRLLKLGASVGLPKSVLAQGREAVKKGQFKSRKVPGR